MLDTCRLASYVLKGKEKQAMKQQKAMLIALIVICFNRYSDGTGNEERPLRGTNPNRPDGGRCLRRLRI